MANILYIAEERVLRTRSLDSKNPNLIPSKDANIIIDGKTYGVIDEIWNFDKEESNSPQKFLDLEIKIILWES